jgi:hypothetical protein
MTIDDELIYELIKPDNHGKIGEGALIAKVVGTRDVQYRLEETTSRAIPFGVTHVKTLDALRFIVEHSITPDITVTFPEKNRSQTAIELENDIAWDFGESLRQIKKYKDKFNDVRVIIPEQYTRFAPLYKNEGFRVYLWKAKRKWQCLRCCTVTTNESRIPPRCSNKTCPNSRREDFNLIGLLDADVNEYELKTSTTTSPL